MKCPNCNEEVAEHVRHCVVCGADVGCPNVRAAQRTEEVDALELRAKEAKDNSIKRGCKKVFHDFRDAVATSSAVINRHIGQINEFASSDNALYQTYYQGVRSERRLPENNDWDSIRGSCKSLFFPNYHDNIRCGSLSINKIGVSGYGAYSVVLKDMAIKDRATVFEENF